MAVASGPMLTALRDRPTHLQRFPDGIEGEEIYQKRVPQKHPDYLETCVVTFPSGRTADALKVTHPSAIVWAAQMGTITLHPWQVRCADTEHPDELRIDLDPQPGTGFKEASAIAVDVLKPLLDELGLVGFPKTSGGRGVHVFLRVKPDWDFIAVRRAGIALAREIERRAPSRHHVVVEGRARQAAVHRLQPERARPHVRVDFGNEYPMGAQCVRKQLVDHTGVVRRARPEVALSRAVVETGERHAGNRGNASCSGATSVASASLGTRLSGGGVPRFTHSSRSTTIADGVVHRYAWH